MKLMTYSHNGAKELLEKKEVLEECRRIPEIWAEYPYQRNYEERGEALCTLGNWETEAQIDMGPESRPHNERLTPFFDVYNRPAQVAVEHELKEQMRARWHIQKMEVGYRDPETLPVDAGVIIYPTNQDPSLRRTRRELTGPFFSEYFPIEVPLYVIEYDSSD